MAKEFPAVRPEHVEGAKLYADRYHMMKSLGIPQRSILAEVGVAHGGFSEFLINEFNPSRFYALDAFDLEKSPLHWGVPQEVALNGKTHFNFYRDRFSHLGERVTMVPGLSSQTLPALPDEALDMIYIDAGHEYKDVALDALNSARKVKRDGFIVFNDYIFYDHFQKVEYGVVPAVNEMLDAGGWRVVGFALEINMFCDIAIARVV